MSYIDPHIHMVSRTTDDYRAMALAGCIAIGEPAFWAGFDRSSELAFEDYFRQLTEFEPRRAAQFGIQHYTWICMNPKESENVSLSRRVIEKMLSFLDAPNVIGVGEIGLNRVTRNELRIFEEQLEIAVSSDRLVMIHTPHLEDKLKGTKIILKSLAKQKGLKPEKILIDHIEEHTAEMVLGQGLWAGMTLYPSSKMSVPRAVDLIEKWGIQNLMVNSGGDWGPSDPLMVPKFALEMRLRGHSHETIQNIILNNPYKFMSKSGKFRVLEQ